MTTLPTEPAPQLGLLDLSVDLSVPEVYSGADFTLYLHIKNPFSIPVWVESVELSLPAQLQWRSIGDGKWRWRRRSRATPENDALHRLLAEQTKKLARIKRELKPLEGSSDERAERLRAEAGETEAEAERIRNLIAKSPHNVSFHLQDDATLNLYDPRAHTSPCTFKTARPRTCTGPVPRTSRSGSR
ncbi:hypothetical protein [Streptomyces sp. NBC_01190]|uniref:hypothetical protein n=1 Tax=Streptomyces sp. NBC_01190 TaxID=2903767 RepID=UPI0038699413|nr:hypothetical protein OG519_19875 [Streptomyces sp. NBC_01190]